MSKHTLIPALFATAPTYEGTTLNDYYSNFGTFTFNGSTDGGGCLQIIGDGKDITVSSDMGIPETAVYFADDAVIPISAKINSVQFIAQVKANGADFSSYGGVYFTYGGSQQGPISFTSGVGSAYSLLSTSVLTVNPATRLSWVRADLFSDGDIGSNGNGSWLIGAIWLTYPLTATSGYDYMGLVVDYVGLEVTSAFPPWGGIYGGARIDITGKGFKP